MAEVKLTPAQQAVVDDRGGALLVSAAAGSGKTKVLVDRLLKQVCDPSDPCNIDEFLVITYTKAAAAELRGKIAQALSQRLTEEPENRHLQRQLHRIYLAEISTVHAFCSGLLRTYAHLLDIPADFRVAEETESKLLQDLVLEELLEQGYAEADLDFLEMAASFGYGRDDRRLPEAVKMAHGEMRCRADMDGWVRQMLETLELSGCTDVSQTVWGDYLLTEFRGFLDRSVEKFQKAMAEMAYYPNIEKGLLKIFTENLAQLQQLRSCGSWDEIVANRVVSFGRAGAIRNPEDAAVKERIAKVRTLCWTELKTWQEYFFAGSDSVLEDLRQTTAGAKALLRFTAAFDRAYAAEKKRRKLLDFSDLEHQAIRLLTDRYTGRPTKAAEEISGRFREIMVDEYQDSNQVQDTIFEALSRNGQNRFMVGDVKQSIYRFRLAEPELFLRKYEAYPDHTESEPGKPRKILLSHNFRSRPEILAACNDVFRLIMRRQVGGLDYGDKEALRPGRNCTPAAEPMVELHCLTNTEKEEKAPDKSEQEANYVARQIRAMLDAETPVTDGDTERPIRPGDIVILMRSLSSTANTYLQALGRYGVPAVCDRGGSLLETSEVQILLAILQIVDNPHQDVPLITAMASPVFGFTPDELARPRTQNRKDDYYDTILAAARPGDKLDRFLQLLEALRQELPWKNLHELIDSVLEKTGLLAVFAAMEDGIRRQRNLQAFRAFAVNFEATGSKSLPQLLWHLQQLQETGGQLPMPKGAAENAVTLMTVHSSKGLEFPVVFLCDLSRRFNRSDMQDAILVDQQLAVGYSHVDHERFVRYPTVARQAIALKKTRESVSEELRILYVAMTRARERLIMTYYSRHLLSELKNINSQLTMPIGDDLCASAGCPGKWILTAALCRTEAGALLNLVEGNDVSRVWDTTWKIVYADLAAAPEAEEIEGLLLDREKQEQEVKGLSLLTYEYPYAQVCDQPRKLTATQLKGRRIDEEAADGAGERKSAVTGRFRRPHFLQQGLTPQERGTATHLFMQFADYHACASAAGIAEELERLVQEEFLTQAQASAVETAQILQLFRSELGSWLLTRQELHREFKFSLLVPHPDAAGEQAMLQGVVDCFVCEPDGITVLDFKTDRVPDPERYRGQLEAYGSALSRIWRLPIKEKLLYFFATGTAIKI